MNKKCCLALAICLCMSNNIQSYSQNINAGVNSQSENVLISKIKSNQNNVFAHYNLCLLYLKNKNIDNATKELKTVFDLINSTNINDAEKEEILNSLHKSDNVEVKELALQIIEDYFDMADMYHAANQYPKAINCYKYILNIDKNNDSALFKIAKSYLRLNDINNATVNIQNALLLKPDNEKYLYLKKEIINTAVKIGDIPANLQNSDFYNQRGVDFFNNNDLENAKKYFTKAIEMDSNSEKAYFNLAKLELKNKSYNEVFDLGNKIVSLKPESPAGYFILASYYKEQNQIQLADKYYDMAIQKDDNYYPAYYDKAILKYKNNQINAAIIDLQAALKIAPGDYDANYTLGIIYANQSRIYEAINCLNKAIELNKQNPEAFYNLAVLYQNAGEFDKSASCYIKALNLNPDDKRIYMDLSKNYLNSKDYGSAEKSLIKARDIDPKDAEIYNYLGIVYQGQGLTEQAKESFEKAISLNPDRPIYHYNYSKLYLALNEQENSILEFQKAINVKTENIQNIMDFVTIYQDREMYAYAIDSIQKAINISPDNEYLYIKQANLYKKSGDPNNAKIILEKVLQAKPDTAYKAKIEGMIKDLSL